MSHFCLCSFGYVKVTETWITSLDGHESGTVLHQLYDIHSSFDGLGRRCVATLHEGAQLIHMSATKSHDGQSEYWVQAEILG
jgi:hypothetical protein